MQSAIFKWFALLFSMVCFPAWAATYYIAPTGNDTAAGTSLALALAYSIAKANASLVAGDTVFIAAGTYTEPIRPANSGTSSARITYKALGPSNVTLTSVGNTGN